MFSTTVDNTICLENDLLALLIINSSSHFMSSDRLLCTHFCLQSEWSSTHSSVKINGTMLSSVCDKAMKYIKKKCGDEDGNYVTHILQSVWYEWLQNTKLTMTIMGVDWYRGYGATTPSHLGHKLAGPLCIAFSSVRQPQRRSTSSDMRAPW
jgi:hypothetical protein